MMQSKGTQDPPTIGDYRWIGIHVVRPEENANPLKKLTSEQWRLARLALRVISHLQKCGLTDDQRDAILSGMFGPIFLLDETLYERTDKNDRTLLVADGIKKMFGVRDSMRSWTERERMGFVLFTIVMKREPTVLSEIHDLLGSPPPSSSGSDEK